MGILNGRKGLIVGVANDRSLAWGIARSLHGAGAELAFTYQGDLFKKRVEPLAASLDSPLVVPCDVSEESDVETAVATAADKLGGLDMLVHSVAYADKEALQGPYMNVQRQAFLRSMEISVYSLTSLCRHAAPHMRDGGSILTLSYLGAERAFRNYNVMGVAKAALESSVRYLARDLGERNIRVNVISAGPVRTLSASGVSQFSSMLKHAAERAPLGRNITSSDVGSAALFLLSELSGGITGEILHVDAGYSTVGA